MDKVDLSKAITLTDGEEKRELSTKEAARGQLLRKVREHNLIISTRLENSKPLIEQMLKYNIHHKEGDDLVDALMLSCYEPPKGASGLNGRMSFGGKITFDNKVDRYGFRI
jgi:hypothetical protein